MVRADSSEAFENALGPSQILIMITGHYSHQAEAVAGSREERRVGADMLSESAWQAIARSLEFSGRELEIVRGVFEDRTEFAIASDLNISPHTVHTHVERLHHKLQVANRLQLVLRVMDEFLKLTVSRHTNLPPVCANWQSGKCPRTLVSR